MYTPIIIYNTAHLFTSVYWILFLAYPVSNTKLDEYVRYIVSCMPSSLYTPLVIARFAYLECHFSLFRTVRCETCPCSVATLLSS